MNTFEKIQVSKKQQQKSTKKTKDKNKKTYMISL